MSASPTLTSPRQVVFLLASGLRIAADAYGDPGAPPVLFLHGGGQTRHAWGGTAEALAREGYLAITMDHRGHGESDWHPQGEYDVGGFVEDLRGVVARLGRPPILVGASLGGITSLLAETAKPESICCALVLVDVTHRLELEGVKKILSFMAARPEGFASPEEAADFVAAYLPHRPRPKDVRGLTKNLRRGDDGRYRWHWDPKLMKLWNPERFDPELGRKIVAERLEAAARLKVPTLLVRGRMSDVVSESSARELLAVVPHAEYVDLAGAGHMVAGDRNDAFTEAILAFVRKVTPT
jgi:non-heme chloroperoxidase